MTAFSFYATKTITTGEGGMLTTDNDDFAQRVTRCGYTESAEMPGSDTRRTGLGITKFWMQVTRPIFATCWLRWVLRRLAKCDDFARRRRSIAEVYRSSFASLEEVDSPPAPPDGIEHAWHLFILRIRPETMSLNRNQFVDELKRSGIGTSVHFIPLHLHQFYQSAYG